MGLVSAHSGTSQEAEGSPRVAGILRAALETLADDKALLFATEFLKLVCVCVSVCHRVSEAGMCAWRVFVHTLAFRVHMRGPPSVRALLHVAVWREGLHTDTAFRTRQLHDVALEGNQMDAFTIAGVVSMAMGEEAMLQARTYNDGVTEVGVMIYMCVFER